MRAWVCSMTAVTFFKVRASTKSPLGAAVTFRMPTIGWCVCSVLLTKEKAKAAVEWKLLDSLR